MIKENQIKMIKNKNSVYIVEYHTLLSLTANTLFVFLAQDKNKINTGAVST